MTTKVIISNKQYCNSKDVFFCHYDYQIKKQFLPISTRKIIHIETRYNLRN